mmetsp:Transcript_16153/g.26370  ORF Transcript_16153/g.26370 Transcript_16153/m.26370 type:complete len:308 (-) Transcript_16153:63-986(-)|eukprot:CAMPEP_0203748072 /NCGR_PEP_ID=MMETSP0098-20131031/3046_1 /ASSEMBLY_ACC=CAM_ASM_000208 /TAXON_ID=96639 /ORGANISM=" , Strain NY0313808BC1" /LENGTH=307 /DNA_ID=CAMNT_0050636689 /DNA_START=641 /DNA_END=1564 /DNA_ORIENTATION=-
MGKSSDPECYLLASACAATVNYPLWKASAINQSGFVQVKESGFRGKFNSFVKAVSPPYRGVPAVIGGMTWARACIFYGSDLYRAKLNKAGAPQVVSTTLPPLLLSSMVQCINMPIVRASITMQNPQLQNDPKYRTTFSTLRHLSETKGFFKLWHGLSAGLAKSVPKYVASVVVKDACDKFLPEATTDGEFLARASVKSVVAGVAGAVLTNPMDVVRNEMFKTDLGFVATLKSLRASQIERGLQPMAWATRGLTSNLIAVSIPITVTIFLTDVFIRVKKQLGEDSCDQKVKTRKTGGNGGSQRMLHSS